MYSNYYVKDLSMGQVHSLKKVNDYSELVKEIIDENDFIAITEHIDKSLVVLKMLLDLDLGDILYMSAKTQGSFMSSKGRDGPRCIYIVPSFLTPGMKESLHLTIRKSTSLQMLPCTKWPTQAWARILTSLDAKSLKIIYWHS